MIRILTSSLNLYKDENGIVENIKNNIKEKNSILFISTGNEDKNTLSSYSNSLFNNLKSCGIEFNNYLVLSNENKNLAKKYVEEANMIFLCGGDQYQQLRFFNDINLGYLLENFNGLIIGQSAGAINMADIVFNSWTNTYFNGLGLTNINLPTRRD